MKSGFAIATTVALTLTMFSTAANAITQDLILRLQNHTEADNVIAPIVSPAYYGDQPASYPALRRGIDLFEQNDRDSLPMALNVVPLPRPWQEASIKPIFIPLPHKWNYRERIMTSKTRRLPTARRFSLRQSTLAPMAFVEYCIKNKKLCAPSTVSEITLSAPTFSTLETINKQVNRSIRPRRERIDIWQSGVKTGDCEDFALTKRAKLLDMGFSASALRMAVATTPSGEGHAVLVVSTNRGDFVLDNRNDEIRAFNHTDLSWVKIQGKKTPLLWNEI